MSSLNIALERKVWKQITTAADRDISVFHYTGNTQIIYTESPVIPVGHTPETPISQTTMRNGNFNYSEIDLDSFLWAYAVDKSAEITVTPKEDLTVQVFGGREFVRSVNTKREDLKISGDGQFFNVNIVRPGVVPAGVAPNLIDEFYYTIETGDKYGILEGMFVDAQETTDVSSARYTLEIEMFFDDSTRNDFTATGGAVVNGVSLNSAHINDVQGAVIMGGVTGNIISGVSDLRPLHYDSIVNSQGSSRTRSDVASSFFSDGKLVVLAPNTKVLVRSTLKADTAVAVDLFTQVFFSEYDLFPA